MRVFISADIEGVSGVVDAELQTSSTGKDYERARRLMTEDVNAAIRGVFSAGAKEVLVCDGHGASNMRNILLEELDPRAHAVLGAPRPLTQMEAIDSRFAVAMFVGYHAMAGSNGILSHTISGRSVAGVKVNGVRVGETGLNALIAGAFGVSVGLVTGDQWLKKEAQALMPWVDAVVIKRAITRTSAVCPPLEVSRKDIEEAAHKCVLKAASGDRYRTLTTEMPIEYEIAFSNSGYCDAAARASGVTRHSAVALGFSAQDPVAGFKMLRSLIGLAQ